MRIQDIRQAKRAEPFKPFKLHLADGRELQIDHPEFILLSRSERTIVLDDVGGNIEIIDPLPVTRLSIPGGQPGPRGE